MGKFVSCISFSEVDACDLVFEYGTYALILPALLWAYKRRRTGELLVALLFSIVAELAYNIGADEPPSFGREESIATVMVLREYLSFHRLLLWGVVIFVSDRASSECYLSKSFFPRLLGALILSAALYAGMIPSEASKLSDVLVQFEKCLIVQSSYTLGLGLFDAIHEEMCKNLPTFLQPLVMLLKFLYVALSSVGHVIIGDRKISTVIVCTLLMVLGIYWAAHANNDKEADSNSSNDEKREIKGGKKRMRVLLLVIIAGWFGLGVAADETKVTNALFYAGLACSLLFVAFSVLIKGEDNTKETKKRRRKYKRAKSD